jgi:anti-sigma-K factor RskA
LTDRREIEARLLEGLGAEERAGVREVAALLADAAPPARPPAELEQRTLTAIRTAAAPPLDGRGPRPAAAPPARPRLRSWFGRRRLALAGGMAVALAAAAVAGALLDREAGLPGQLELEATLRAPDGGGSATASVRATGIGRVIEFRTNDLPVLPEGEYYELWFVGPGDRPRKPNRISAGTFHPDENGRSRVRFAAAVDPAKYGRLAVTAEPGDGNPAPNGPDVLRSRPEGPSAQP